MASGSTVYVPLQGRRGHNLTNVWGQLVSQGDATEKLAHQVAAQVAAPDRRVEEASGDPHEEETDEAHKSSKGHVSEPAAGCPTSPEPRPSAMKVLEKQPAVTTESPRAKSKDHPQRLKPPH